MHPIVDYAIRLGTGKPKTGEIRLDVKGGTSDTAEGVSPRAGPPWRRGGAFATEDDSL